MITANGYSKDPQIMPEGIVITFGREMMAEQGGPKLFLANFLQTMEDYEHGDYWRAKMKNLPTADFDHVYLSVLGRLYGRVYYGGAKRYDPDNPEYGWTADDRQQICDWNHIVLSGPFEPCPFKRKLKGFQGFRYCTKLF